VNAKALFQFFHRIWISGPGAEMMGPSLVQWIVKIDVSLLRVKRNVIAGMKKSIYFAQFLSHDRDARGSFNHDQQKDIKN
jgi:hypothetical protein